MASRTREITVHQSGKVVHQQGGLTDHRARFHAIKAAGATIANQGWEMTEKTIAEDSTVTWRYTRPGYSDVVMTDSVEPKAQA